MDITCSTSPHRSFSRSFSSSSSTRSSTASPSLPAWLGHPLLQQMPTWHACRAGRPSLAEAASSIFLVLMAIDVVQCVYVVQYVMLWLRNVGHCEEFNAMQIYNVGMRSNTTTDCKGRPSFIYEQGAICVSCLEAVTMKLKACAHAGATFILPSTRPSSSFGCPHPGHLPERQGLHEHRLAGRSHSQQQLHCTELRSLMICSCQVVNKLTLHFISELLQHSNFSTAS